MTAVHYVKTTRHEDWGGQQRYICVVVLPDQEAFTKHLTKKSPELEWSGAEGGFCPHPIVETWDKKTQKWVRTSHSRFVGTMYLIADKLFSEIIAHESTHVASAIYRWDCASEINLGDNCGQNEENFAYMIGDIYWGIVEALTEDT